MECILLVTVMVLNPQNLLRVQECQMELEDLRWGGDELWLQAQSNVASIVCWLFDDPGV